MSLLRHEDHQALARHVPRVAWPRYAKDAGPALQAIADGMLRTGARTHDLGFGLRLVIGADGGWQVEQ